MSNAIITNSILTDIANAIRLKTGSQETMLPSEMAGNIADIPSGSGSITLVWTNPNDMSTAFGQQTIQMDLSAYSYIIMKVYSDSTSKQYNTFVFKVGTSSTSVSDRIEFADKVQQNMSSSIYRQVSVRSTEISFALAYYAWNSSGAHTLTSNYIAIPYKIWGVTTDLTDLT